MSDHDCLFRMWVHQVIDEHYFYQGQSKSKVRYFLSSFWGNTETNYKGENVQEACTTTNTSSLPSCFCCWWRHCLLSAIIFCRFHVIGVGQYPTFTLPYLISSYLSLPYILPYLTSYLPTFRYLTSYFTLPHILPHILPYLILPLTLGFALPYLTSRLTLP